MAFVYLLGKKSEATAKIKDFISYCRTQYAKTNKVLQFNGRGELMP